MSEAPRRPAPVRARLASAQGDPPIGAERIAVYHDDGRIEEVALHDYARVYALPGVYEQIVQEDLGCRSPQTVAEMLTAALDGPTRVIDLAAGNGVSGEALRDAGHTVVLGTDVVPEAREAALRDRPGVYGEYLTRDLTELDPAEAERLRALGAQALTCVSPVGSRPGQVPPAAIAAGAGLLTPDALLVALHDPRHGAPESLSDEFWRAHGYDATRLERRRYLHRFRVTGAPYELEASIWHLRRG